MDGADESGRRPGLRLLWVSGLMGFLLCNWVDGFEDLNVTEHQFMDGYGFSTPPLMVGLTLIAGAASTGAVCLDGTLPGYHLHRGYGSGANSWLIHLEVYSKFWISTSECSEMGSFGYLAGTRDSTLLLYQAGASTNVGGGWCNTIRNCVFRKKTPHGSSTHMEKLIPFTGILSNRAEENPDFYNWNRVKLRYCDGASFSGDSQNEAKKLYFRGQRIWLAAMKDLMSKGMYYANQALLSGCSAGGLAAILHCDEFRELFPRTTRVKCLSDAGLFLDVIDVSGGRTLRHMFGGVVRLQQVGKMLPQACTSRLNPILCFFPQHLIPLTKTPLFLLNAAYDSWQILASLAPHSADPRGYWQKCRLNYAYCSSSQIQFLQDFRKQMLNAVGGFSGSKRNGLFINSCFAHCQTERQDTWFAHNSPRIGNKGIAQSVGDWYFDRAEVKGIDCPYPCDKTCHNLVFRQSF